jgi:hypothetical protein
MGAYFNVKLKGMFALSSLVQGKNSDGILLENQSCLRQTGARQT